MRKPVFGVCDQVRLKPVCSATETSWNLEMLDSVSTGTIPSRQRTTKTLKELNKDLRLCCSHMRINRFSHDMDKLWD